MLKPGSIFADDFPSLADWLAQDARVGRLRDLWAAAQPAGEADERRLLPGCDVQSGGQCPDNCLTLSVPAPDADPAAAAAVCARLAAEAGAARPSWARPLIDEYDAMLVGPGAWEESL